MSAFEINFDSLVGPTHNYAGLSFGNIASQKFAHTKSNPKQAALQGLAKMKFLHDLGIRQAVIPPQPRPNLGASLRLGIYGGTLRNVLKELQSHPQLQAAVFSASAMWAANAATVSPSSDSYDNRAHITPANLITQFHRSLETPVTTGLLRQIFPASTDFAHHDALPASPIYADEGAANHMRMSAAHDQPGIEIFVYGADAYIPESTRTNFPARQTLQSVQALSRVHRLNPERCIFIKQNPRAIDAGVFHNDVIAVANCDVLLCHAAAWENMSETLAQIRDHFASIAHGRPWIFVAEESELSLSDAVQTYIFNSQLVSLPDGTMAMIAPLECRNHPGVQKFIARILAADSPIREVHYLDVRQSMQNGGGPACLRLRIVLNEAQFSMIHPGVIFTDTLYAELTAWVSSHYRQELSADDFADPAFANESGMALIELEKIIGLTVVPR